VPPRAYLRLDPHVYERKVLGVDADGVPIEGWRAYSPAEFVAFVGCLALADQQPQRGYFRSERVLRELLRGADGTGARIARLVPDLISRGDLIVQAGGRIYVDGWTEWQEGDLTVAERMRRMRARQGHRNGVTPTVTPTVTVPVTVDRRARDARGRSAEAVSISGGGGGAPVTRTGRGLATDDDRVRAIAANRDLLGSPDVTVQRAALRALRRLDPETSWELPAPTPVPTARPRR
jgi:hypothetical protein